MRVLTPRGVALQGILALFLWAFAQADAEAAILKISLPPGRRRFH